MKNQFHAIQFLSPPSTEVSHFLAADNQLVICCGVNPSYKMGELRKDTGYAAVNSAIVSSKKIYGLYNFRQSPTVNKILASLSNSGDTATDLYYKNSGTWTKIGTLSSVTDSFTCFESFIGYCFIVGHNGTSFLTNNSLTGTTLSTSTNITNMAQGKFIKRYRDRLYVANSYYSGSYYPYRIYYSSVPSAGAITWTPATDYIDVDFSEQITGTGSNWDRLVVFTEFSAYMYDQVSWKKTWSTGCGQHRTIADYDAYLIWANKDNVWASTGGQPQAIGNDVLELLRTASPNMDDWSAVIVDREYNLYVGNASANGISYHNCLLTYDLQTGMWRWRELGNPIQTLAMVSSLGEDYLYMGGIGNGTVYVKGRYVDTSPYSTDDGLSISSWFRTKAYDFTDPSVLKRISKVITYAEGAKGLQVYFRSLDSNQEVLMPFKSVGSIHDVIQEFNSDMQGRFIQFEFKEIGKNKYWKFYGFTALVEQVTKN